MNRRNFIGTMLGTLAASSVGAKASTPAVVNPLEGFVLYSRTGVRGTFINGAFVRVYDMKNSGSHIAVNPDYFDAPVELEVWAHDEKGTAVVARDRISGSLRLGEMNCGVQTPV